MAESDTIELETIIHAPVQKLWQGWTDPAIVLRWFGSDPDGEGVSAEMDVRPGGSFEITFRNSNLTEHTCYGVYLEVDEYSKLRFTWSWKSEPGVESTVTVRLFPENDFSRMMFEHANVGHASAHDYYQGWKSTFIKLDRLMSR